MGVVGAVEDVPGDAMLPDLSDHQNPRLDFACFLAAEKDAVLMVAAHRAVTLERVGRLGVHCFPCQHGYLSSGTRGRPTPGAA